MKSMSSVRKTIISNCEKEFLLRSLGDNNRLDGRAFNEFRDVKIEFGKDWGCCYVSLGKTRTLAQVSCELQYPKASRPSEGILHINLELNPMADPNFEAGRASEMSAQLNRLLEKCIKDSKAVDLESLCVKMNERVWAFRVDINVLNHEGNILDCASIAALAALAHFRRPDITCDGEEYKIHTYKQRDPIATVLHHYPVCVTYAIYKEGQYILADPNFVEEGVSEAFLSVALNSYKELCGLQLGGKAQLKPNIVLETTNKAAKRAVEIVQLIKKVVEGDTEKRKDYFKEFGFHKHLDEEVEELGVPLADLSICLDHWSKSNVKKRKKYKNIKAATQNEELANLQNCDRIEIDNQIVEEGVKENIVEPAENSKANVESNIKSLGDGTAEVILVEREIQTWDIVDSDESGGEDVVYVETSKPKVETIDIPSSDASEEDAVIVLNADKKTNKKKKKKQKT